MDTVQRPVMSFKSTIPDSSRSSCPHAPGKNAHTVMTILQLLLRMGKEMELCTNWV